MEKDGIEWDMWISTGGASVKKSVREAGEGLVMYVYEYVSRQRWSEYVLWSSIMNDTVQSQQLVRRLLFADQSDGIEINSVAVSYKRTASLSFITVLQLVAKVLAQNSDFVRKWSASVKWHGRSLLSCTGSFCMRSRLSPMGAVSISVALCCLAAEKSRGLARETAEAFLLLFKGVNAENCQQAHVPFLYCLGAVAYRPGVKQVQGLYQFNGRAGGGRQGMREVAAP